MPPQSEVLNHRVLVETILDSFRFKGLLTTCYLIPYNWSQTSNSNSAVVNDNDSLIFSVVNHHAPDAATEIYTMTLH